MLPPNNEPCQASHPTMLTTHDLLSFLQPNNVLTYSPAQLKEILGILNENEISIGTWCKHIYQVDNIFGSIHFGDLLCQIKSKVVPYPDILIKRMFQEVGITLDLVLLHKFREILLTTSYSRSEYNWCVLIPQAFSQLGIDKPELRELLLACYCFEPNLNYNYDPNCKFRTVGNCMKDFKHALKASYYDDAPDYEDKLNFMEWLDGTYEDEPEYVWVQDYLVCITCGYDIPNLEDGNDQCEDCNDQCEDGNDQCEDCYISA
jgi:hypothetical protein